MSLGLTAPCPLPYLLPSAGKHRGKKQQNVFPEREEKWKKAHPALRITAVPLDSPPLAFLQRQQNFPKGGCLPTQTGLALLSEGH